MSQQDRRRAERVPGQFLVMVQGLDDGLVLRHGDISTVGLAFAADDLNLEVGSLEYLHVMAPDRTAGVVVMAQVARLFSVEGGPRGATHQVVAFELLVRDPAQEAGLEALVARISGPPPAPDEDEGPAQGSVFSLNVVRLELEATWPVAVGEKVQLVMSAFGGDTRIPFEGEVKSVRVKPLGQGGARYVAQVRLLGAGLRAAQPRHPTITQSIDLVMNDLMAAVHTSDLSADRTHLKGRLDRIPLTGLLSWFHMERMSGRLSLKSEGQAMTLFLASGDVVDVDPAEDVEPRARLAEALGWTQGRFQFVQGEVGRPDRVGVPLHALLMDLAREADEAAHRERLAS
jgi:hypothetical protein